LLFCSRSLNPQARNNLQQLTEIVAGAAGATYGLDNLNAGAKSLADGKAYATWGAKAISETFGVPLDSAELLYSVPSLTGGAKTLAQGSKLAGKSVAKEVTKTAK
jgi:hypothetical protein